jgi:hypothetical protein
MRSRKTFDGWVKGRGDGRSNKKGEARGASPHGFAEVSDGSGQQVIVQVASRRVG